MSGTVGSTSRTEDSESVELCDSTGARFIRTFVHNTAGTVTGTVDSTLAGAVFAPVAPVGVCEDCCPVVLSTELCATGDRTVTSLRLADGTILLVDNETGATVLPADIIACPAGCSTAASIGTVCYTPPVAVQTLQDDWTGTASAVGGGSRVWTNSNFAGQGITVTETVTPDTGAALLGNGVRNTATNPASQHTAIDLGAPRTNVTVRMDFFGAVQGERLRNVTPAFSGVSGNGTAVLANTGVDAGPAGDGTIFMLFPGPVQNISWDYAPTGGGLSGQSFISFNTGNASNTAPAAVLRDCDTGETTFVDLATGTELDPLVISIVDCPGEGDVVEEANPEIDSTLQRQTGVGAVNIPAGARSVTVTVLAGNPTAAIGGGAAVTLVPGLTLTWAVETGGPDGEVLQDAFAFTGVAGSDFLVNTTREV